MYVQHYIPSNTINQNNPRTHHTPGHNNQMLPEKAPAGELDENNQKRLQKIVGKFLYCDRAMDPTMLVALKSLVMVQTKPTIETTKKQRKISRHSDIINKKHNYYPPLLVCIPHIRNIDKKQSQRIFFLGPKFNTPIQEMFPDNRPVHVECSIIRNLMASATESELGGLFENYQKATSMGTILAEIVCQQPATPVETDNTAANIIVNGTAK